MLRKRARAARARLPVTADVPAAPPVAESAPVERPVWSEPVLQSGESLWFCIRFIHLNDENKEVFSLDEAMYLWAYQYTPVLSGAGNLLFLEVAASLRLFGGLQGLRERIETDLQARGYTTVIACALTPRAAEWLALAGQSLACADRTTLRQAVAALPLQVSGWPDKVQLALGQMGMRTLGCCLKLPRAGFARRVGATYLQALDEALGRRPQLLRSYTLPLYFRRRVELAEESMLHAWLLDAAQASFKRLGNFLRRRQAAVQRFDVWLLHRGQPATRLRVGTGRPTAETTAFTQLTALQLERLTLVAPVTAVEVRAQAEPAPRGGTLGLPGIAVAAETPSGDGWQDSELLARLRARLGGQRVYQLDVVAEHRPECAWQVAEQPAVYRLHEAPDTLQRPLWLLAQPQRITAPLSFGDSAVELTVERIESGWWDGGDMRRDYYRVTTPTGTDRWVYRDCRSQVWYLHGLFG